MRSTTRTFIGDLPGSSFSASCSCSAVKMLGPLSCSRKTFAIDDGPVYLIRQ